MLIYNTRIILKYITQSIWFIYGSYSFGRPGLPPSFVQVTEPVSQVNPVHTTWPEFPQIAWQSSAHESTAVVFVGSANDIRSANIIPENSERTWVDSFFMMILFNES